MSQARVSRTATGHPPRRSVQPWFFAYGLLGLVQNGAAPILLPLSAGTGAKGGLIYAAWASAGLLAPVLGAWADRRGHHLFLVLAGLPLSAAAIGAFSFVDGALPHAALAFVGGFGVVATSIVGTIFIVGHCPEEEWDERIGVLQGFVSAGQIAGLLLAGVCARLPHTAFLGASLALLAAWPIAWRWAPRDLAPVPRRAVRAPAPVGGEAAATGTQRVHHASLRGIASLGWLPHGGLRRFLGVWLLSYTATNAVAVMFPVALTHEFGAAAILPSGAYAAGILLSLPIYGLAGRWEHKGTAWGSADGLMRAGLVGRLVGTRGPRGARLRASSLGDVAGVGRLCPDASDLAAARRQQQHARGDLGASRSGRERGSAQRMHGARRDGGRNRGRRDHHRSGFWRAVRRRLRVRGRRGNRTPRPAFGKAERAARLVVGRAAACHPAKRQRDALRDAGAHQSGGGQHAAADRADRKGPLPAECCERGARNGRRALRSGQVRAEAGARRELGAGRAGTECQDVDGVAGVLGCQGFGQGQIEGLARGIGCEKGHRKEGDLARRHDHPCSRPGGPRPLDHARQKTTHQHQRRHDVDLDSGAQNVFGRGRERAVGTLAGVADEQVGLEALARLADGVAAGVGRKISRHRLDRAPLAFEFGRENLQGPGIAAGQ